METDKVINKLGTDIMSVLGQEQKIKISNSIVDGILREHKEQLSQIDEAFNQIVNKIPVDNIMAIIGSQLNRIAEYTIQQNYINCLNTTECYLMSAINYIDQIGIVHCIDRNQLNEAFVNAKHLLSEASKGQGKNLKQIQNYFKDNGDDNKISLKELMNDNSKTAEDIKNATMQIVTIVSQMKGLYHKWRLEQTRNFTDTLHKQISNLFNI